MIVFFYDNIQEVGRKSEKRNYQYDIVNVL